MKKITKLFIFFLLISGSAVAQVPQYFNTNVAGGANSWPFNNITTARRIQFYIPPNNLGSVTAGNNITKIWFQGGSGATNTYPILNVKLKQGPSTMTGLTGTTGGPMEPGMTLVYTGSNITLTSVTGSWFSITLQTPFLYDPAFPLIVEIEHNATSGTGPTIYQSGAITGPGWGRQWADYNTNSITSPGGTERANFGIDVLPATPCTVIPTANTAVGPTVAVCPNSSANVGLATTYSFGGITYQWQSSTVSAVGPFTAISGATSNVLASPNVTTATWFNAVITCTNVVGTITTAVASVSVSPVITSTVPYFESFESIGTPNKLPNCSWSASNLGGTCQTYTSSNTLGRMPRTGNSFASFYYTPVGAKYFYTNGIYLNAGITYSASTWYQTEYYGYNNWTDLSILYGTTQTPTGQISIATTNGPAVSNVYKPLSGTFTVATSGLYYVSVRATSTSGSASYLTWDDLAITIPCDAGSPNTPTINLVANSSTICSGESVSLNSSGADTYTWSTGSNAGGITDTPPFTTMYSVVGTNTLTGCTNTVNQTVVVNSTPVILVVTNKQTVCSGSPANLTALGASSYTWSNGLNGMIITVNPTVATTYSVLATGSNGCTGSSSQLINVNPLPTVSAATNRPNEMCPTETAILTAAGNAVSFQWISNTSPLVLSGNPINVSPSATAIYTVTGADANGCQKSTTVVQNVVSCTGIGEQTALSGMHVYPNPTSGEFSIASNNTLTKTVEVMDVTGKIVSTLTSNLEVVKLNITTLSNGIYYIKIQSNTAVEVVKVVKQ